MPTAAELSVLQRVYEHQQSAFQQHPASAAKLLSIGEAAPDASLAAAELAAWTVVASAIMNTDEALTKG